MPIVILLGVIVIAVLLLYGFMGGNVNSTDIRTYASNAGFEGADLDTAVAIAMAESGGNPRAYNPETAAGTPDGKGSYGLWQIYLKAHPEFDGEDLYDAQTNANAAYSVYVAAGGSFSPWSTYNNGAYTQFMPTDGAVSA